MTLAVVEKEDCFTPIVESDLISRLSFITVCVNVCTESMQKPYMYILVMCTGILLLRPGRAWVKTL